MDGGPGENDRRITSLELFVREEFRPQRSAAHRFSSDRPLTSCTRGSKKVSRQDILSGYLLTTPGAAVAHSLSWLHTVQAAVRCELLDMNSEVHAHG